MWRIVLAVALAAGLAATASGASAQAGGQNGTLRVDSETATVGEEVSVNVELRNLPAPGLGAWSATLHYDPSHLTVVSCTAHYNGICDTSADPNAVRASAAVTQSLSGDFTLATVVFRCNDASSVSELTPSISVFTTAGVPPPFHPAVEPGTITCAAATETPAATATPTSAALPPSGSGRSHGQPIPWLQIALLAAGAGAIAAGAAWARRRV